MKGMPFEGALVALKFGERIARSGWNGRGMYLFIMRDRTVHHMATPLAARNRNFYAQVPLTVNIEQFSVEPYIAMRTADRKVVPWLASQTDLLSEDWEVVEA